MTKINRTAAIKSAYLDELSAPEYVMRNDAPKPFLALVLGNGLSAKSTDEPGFDVEADIIWFGDIYVFGASVVYFTISHAR